MDRQKIMGKVKNAMLSMQRYSWEQGVAAQAFLELGDKEMTVLFSKEAALRQTADGRLAMMGNISAVTDPAACGEALLFAAKETGNLALREACDKMLDWLLYRAPRSRNGAIYHFHDRPQIWVDSYYMAPPFLAAMGCFEEAMKQIELYRDVLLNREKRMYSHMWDDSLNAFTRKDIWGVGNGWAMAGMNRVLGMLPEAMAEEKNRLKSYIRELVEAILPYLREDGLFHDVVDNPASFVETNFAQMLAYTIFKGVKGGWLNPSAIQAAEKMRTAAWGQVDEWGFVQGVCGSPYFDRPGRATEGQAFFLLMESAAPGYCGNSESMR